MQLQLTLLEAQRIELQQRLDAEKTAAQRNQMGQFATPPALATDILEQALRLLPSGQNVRFLDPAFGTGAFYSAFLRTFSHECILSADGYEIDPHYGAPALRLWKESPLRLHLADFMEAIPPPEAERANLLICNPPYVRHHHLTADQKGRLYDQVHQLTGISLSKLCGLYGYFLILSHAWMAPGGVAGWLIPSEFMDVNYGRQIKKYLLRQVSLLRVHRFEPTDVQFTDALVSSAVIWLHNVPPRPDHTVEFTFGGSLSAPHRARHIASAVLEQTEKWTSVTNGVPYTSHLTQVLAPKDKLKLSDFFSIRRGLATGSNEFFILTSQQAAQHQLPQEFLLPILPSPRYLDDDIIEASVDGTPQLHEPLFLLDCHLSDERVRSEYPALWAYLCLGREREIHLSYLCRHRRPWYSQETRPAAPILCTYMGRRNKDRVSPFRFILNFSSATAANAYHLLYPKPAVAAILGEHRQRWMALWDALSNITPEILVGEGRVYGGGLHKMEPKELGNIPAESIVEALRGFSEALPGIEQHSNRAADSAVTQPNLL